MPKLFVAAEQLDAQSLVRTLLGSRVSAARRENAIIELRRLNPGLDLERIRPGEIVVVPDAAGAGARKEDPVRDSIADLVLRTDTALRELPAESDRAEERRRAAAEEVRALLGSDEVRRLVRSSPQLQQNLASVAAELEKEDTQAQQGRDVLAQATEGWLADLAELAKIADR